MNPRARVPLGAKLGVAFGLAGLVTYAALAWWASVEDDPKAGMTIALAAVCGWMTTGLPALVFGLVGLTQINWSAPGRRTAAALALIGVVIGAFGPVALLAGSAIYQTNR
ncbi:MAG: hypothetical protein K2X82_05955 [Gemmataceae bacterium]|nr:hypothetical protein [Gemmataceae bacterium]